MNESASPLFEIVLGSLKDINREPLEDLKRQLECCYYSDDHNGMQEAGYRLKLMYAGMIRRALEVCYGRKTTEDPGKAD